MSTGGANALLQQREPADTIAVRHHFSERQNRALKLAVPAAVFAGPIVAAFALYPLGRAVEWTGFQTGYLLAPLGREVTIPLMIASGFGPSEAVALVVLVDMAAASFLAWNLDLARAVPYVGGFIDRAEEAGRALRRDHPGLAPLGVAGLFLWALKPGRGSGGATSAVLGKLVFLESRWLLPTILAATLIGCAAVALAAQSVLALQGGAFALLGGSLLVIVALVYGRRIREALLGPPAPRTPAPLPTGDDK
jgi:uncharacterized membrane protein